MSNEVGNNVTPIDNKDVDPTAGEVLLDRKLYFDTKTS